MAQNPNQESDFLNTLKDYQIQSKLSGDSTPLNSPLKGLWTKLQAQEQALSSKPTGLNNTETINALKQLQGMQNTFNPTQSYNNQKQDNMRGYTEKSPSSSMGTPKSNQDPNRSLFLNTMNKLYAPDATYDDNTKNQLSKDLETSYSGLTSQPTNLQDTELVNSLKQIYQSSGSPALYPSASTGQVIDTSQNIPTQQDTAQTVPQDTESNDWLRKYGETHGMDPQQIEDFIGGKIDSVDTPDNDPNADLENEAPDPNGIYNIIDNNESEQPVDGDIEDPQTQQDLQDIYSSPQFADANHEQQTMMKFANNPQLQSHFMSQNPQVVMNTALGQSLEGIANQYMVTPGNPMSERYRQRFDQGTGVYQDPFSEEKVSRPNFFQRLSSALKYVFKGDNKNAVHHDQMQLRNSQSQPQRLPFTENNPFSYPARSDQFTPSTVMNNPLPYMNMGNMGIAPEEETYSIPPSSYLGAGGSYGTSNGMMAGLYSPPLYSR